MKFILLRHTLLLILSLSISLSVFATDKGILPIKEKPLPVKNITVEDLLNFSDNISDELVNVSGEVEEEKQAKASEPPVGMNGFQFAEIDAQLSASMSALPPTDVEVDPMTELFVEMGSGEYSAKIRKARAVIDKAAEVGNFLMQS